jgi:hypothetical protein
MWFFRVVELDGGRWARRHGNLIFDTHAAMPEALEHITKLAVEHRPAELFVHRLDGSVTGLGAV